MYKTKFILGFSNESKDTYEVFFDYLDYTGNSTNLYGRSDCLTIRNTSGDENKMQPILGTEALISIHVGPVYDDSLLINNEVANNTISLADFIAVGDNDIRVTVYRNKNYSFFYFQGFVVVEDNSQPLQDPPFDLNIRATDGLGLLKNVDMIDAEGNLYSGVMPIDQWVANILAKTGQVMNIRFFFPFYNINGDQTQPSLGQVFLDAITFQKGQIITTTDLSVDVFASETDDALTALTKICNDLRCRLFQENGVWHFVSLYEWLDSANGYMYYETALGTLTDGVYPISVVATGANLDFTANVGKNEVIKPVEEDAQLYLKLATKSVKLNYAYDQSLNKLCNQNIQLGDANPSLDGTLSSTILDPLITPTVTFDYKAFDIFCFDHFDVTSDTPFKPYPTASPSTNAYIREIEDFVGYPLDRFITLEAPSVNHVTWVRGQKKITIDQGDIFQMSFQWRTKDDATLSLPTAIETAWVLLYGDDGSFWSLRCLADGSIPGNPNEWESCTDDTFQSSGFITTPEISHTNTWTSVGVNQNPAVGTIDSMKAPVNGQIEVLFLFHDASGGGTEYWFKNISVNILPYLQGTYKELTGDYNFLSSKLNIKQTISEDVNISDSPKRYFKGALLDSDSNILPPQWHVYGTDDMLRFTQHMEKVYFNNVWRILQKIEGTFKGFIWIDSAFNELQSGLLHTYFFVDTEDPQKKYILTSFEKNYATGKGRHVFVEAVDPSINPYVGDPTDTDYIYQFQYLFK